MSIENERDLEALRLIGAIVRDVLGHVSGGLVPGVTTSELDRMAAEALRARGAKSAPQHCYKFPGAVCISVNEELAHGIPGDRVLREGDLVNIDVSAVKDGYFADTGSSFIVGQGSAKKQRLLEATRRALAEACAAARHGAPLSAIGHAIENVARESSFAVIRNLGSHGVGRSLHEAPEFIPGFYDPNEKRVLKKGMVITIEPFLTTGPTMVREERDGWTLSIPRPHLGAQFEHTMVITEDAPILMTA